MPTLAPIKANQNIPETSTSVVQPQADPELELRQAAAKGDKEAVASIIEQGVGLNGRSSNGNTALHWAAQKGHIEVVDLLCAHQARAFIGNKFSKTPLLLAKTKAIETLLIQATEQQAEALLSLECLSTGRNYRHNYDNNRQVYQGHIQNNTKAFYEGLTLAAKLHPNPSVVINGPSDFKDLLNINAYCKEFGVIHVELIDLDAESLALSMGQLPQGTSKTKTLSDLTGGVAAQFFAQSTSIIQTCAEPSKVRALIGEVIGKLLDFKPTFAAQDYDYVVSPEVLSQLSSGQSIVKRFQRKFDQPLLIQGCQNQLPEKINDFANKVQLDHIDKILSQLKPNGLALIAFTQSEGPFQGGQFYSMVKPVVEQRIKDSFKLIKCSQWPWVFSQGLVNQQGGGSYKVRAYLVQKQPESQGTRDEFEKLSNLSLKA